MSCRHQLDVAPTGSMEGAPSGCRRWRRWPSDLPGPANDNGGHVTGRMFRALAKLVSGVPSRLWRLLALES